MAELYKYQKRYLDRLTWPQLLVLKDKHKYTHYLCSDLESFGRACLEVLKTRLDPQHGYIQKPEKTPYGLKDELTEEQIDALPERLRAAERNILLDNKRLRAEHAEELEQYAAAKKAIKDGDGMAAYQVLEARRDYEYEGFELIKPRVA